MQKNTANKQTWILFNNFLVEYYHNLKLTQNLSEGQTGYHSVNAVVSNGGIASALSNLAMPATEDQIHVDHLMEKSTS